MNVEKVLSVVALVIAALVGLAEVNYYMMHRYRPGVSPHLVALSASLVLVAVAVLIRSRKR
ncbi:MAG: hypothetical protein Q7T82_18045 [Armatimonadota bacterium]|nr:hypothetical protein [Armatimonadota bacterium]